MSPAVTQRSRILGISCVYATKGGRLVVTFANGKRTSHARLAAAVKLGRPLDPAEVVHHINRDPGDDRFGNLVVLRSSSEHIRLHHDEMLAERRPRCAVCGGHRDDWTRGCKRCADRHGQRRRRGSIRFAVTQRRWCAGCGVPYTFRTPGCAACNQRHYLRAKAAA